MLEAPEVEGHLHHKTGHSAADKILAVLAVFLSGVSVFIAVHHGKTMERLVAANSWPNISYGTGNVDDATGREVITLTLKNTGVGPARIDSFELFYKGKPLSGLSGFADCCGKGRFNAATSTVLDEVLPARDSINFLSIPKSATAPEIWAAADRERFNIRVRVCYCSVFDECFVRDSSERRPHRVDECRPSQPVEYH
jgi:hypothetical protein